MLAGNTADDLVAVQQRARNLGIGCSKRSREHELSYQFWNLVSIVTTLVIALFSGLAGTALLAQAPTGSALGGGVRAVHLTPAALVPLRVDPLHQAARQHRQHPGAVRKLKAPPALSRAAAGDHRRRCRLRRASCLAFSASARCRCASR